MVFWIILFYLSIGICWTLVSHGLPLFATDDPHRLFRLQMYLDLILVGTTALLLGWGLRRFFLLLRFQEGRMHQMVEGVCAATGEGFFKDLVLSLADMVGADYAFLCEFTDDSRTVARTVAVCADGKIIGNFEFEIENTPCERVLSEGIRCFSNGVREQFPLDHVAIRLGVESYAGIPLRDSSGRVLGPMAVFSRSPIVNLPLAESMLQLFAVRAAAELERKSAQRTIDYMAYYDSLTGLPNRQMFGEHLTRALAHAQHFQENLAVMILDLDRFKTINDSLGHAMGDRLLKEVSGRLGASVPQKTLVARLGGDEFLFLLPDLREAGDAARVAEKILEAMRPSFPVEGMELHVASSLGIALFPMDGKDPEALLKNADTALNRAKELGRNNYQYYMPDMNALSLARLDMETSLRKALERQEFLLFYQPQYELKSGRLVGTEALIRWRHPERGLIGPAEFIPLSEENGLIHSIGDWVLWTACRQMSSWQKRGAPPVTMAVNLSAHQFRQSDLPERIEMILEETGLSPRFLELEITESVLMQSIENTVDQMIRMMNLGIRISIDDFGTGYSSLSYLKKFPIHSLKIDRSFIKDLETDPDNEAIVSAVIAMAHNLKLSVVAEGVETRGQLRFLQARQCDQVQGFLLQRPLPADRFEKMMMANSTESLPLAAGWLDRAMI